MTERRTIPLSGRLIVIYGLLIAATISVVAGIVLYLTRDHLTRELDDRLLAVAATFATGPAGEVDGPSDLGAAAEEWLEVTPIPRDQVAVVVPDDGRVKASTGGLRPEDLPSTLLMARDPRWWSVSVGGEPVRAVSVPLLLEGSQIGTIIVAGSHSEIDSTISTLLSGIGWASAVGLLFAALLGGAAIRRALRPLARMSRDVAVIETTGDLSRRVDHEGPADEVGRLAVSFDRMLARLHESFESQRRFLSDASHELRTPLTIARGQLELLDDALSDPEIRRSLGLAVEELDRMRRIVEDLLLLARLDEGVPLQREPIEVELVVREALLRGMLIGRREAQVDVEPGLHVLADHDRLMQVLTNLVTNAVQHAGERATLALTGRRHAGSAVIEVSDTGRGIPPEEIPHVFERLYRGGARAAGSGSGLGLAIAESLVRAMGGDIWVSSTPGIGTAFTISLPLATSRSNELVPEIGG